jgi:large subunit ribosomal protein L28
VTTSVLRTIDKKGGLDKYLLETTNKNLYSEKALELKSKLLNRIKVEQQKKVVAEPSA